MLYKYSTLSLLSPSTSSALYNILLYDFPKVSLFQMELWPKYEFDWKFDNNVFWPCKATQMRKKIGVGVWSPPNFNSSTWTSKTGLSVRINWLLSGIHKGTKKCSHTFMAEVRERNCDGDLSESDNIHFLLLKLFQLLWLEVRGKKQKEI